MSIKLITKYICDRCHQSTEVEADALHVDYFIHGQLPYNWGTEQGKHLCPDCLKLYREHQNNFFPEKEKEY